MKRTIRRLVSQIGLVALALFCLSPCIVRAGVYVNQYTDSFGYTYHLEAPEDWDGGIYDPLTSSWTTPWYPPSAVITSVTPPSPEPFPDSLGRGISVPKRVSWLRNSGEDPDEAMDVPLTGIGAGAFQGIQGLIRAELPQTCTWVGDNGFRDCSNLTIVSIPDECVSLGSYAFASCTNLVNVDLGNGLQRVGGSAFFGCSSLLEILFPDSLVSIGEATLNGCSALELVSVPFTGKSRDNTLEAREKKFAFIFGTDSFPGSYEASNSHFSLFGNLIHYQLPTALTTVNITTSDHIHDYAFEKCSYITSITLNNGVTSIGDFAFYGCSGLTSITIPDSVTSIGEEAFRGCSGLTSITIPDSVTNIGRLAFCYCTGLTSIRIPKCLTNMGTGAFTYCSGLTSITIPVGVMRIEDAAFFDCSGLKSITIPNSVTNIGNSAFSGCSGLTSIAIPDSVTNIGNSAFSGCSGLTSIAIPDSVTNIPAKAFYNCSKLSDVSIGNGVKGVENNAFYNCTNLTVLSLGTSVDIIHGDAFSRCNNIAEVYVPDLLSWCKISWGSSYNHPLRPRSNGSVSLIVGNEAILERNNLSIDLQGAGKIGTYGLAFLTNVVSVTLPETVIEIGKHAFDGCQSLATINVNVPDVSVWCTNGMNTLLSATRRLWANGQSIYSLSIPDGVTCIGESAFSGFEFGKVTIPDSVTVIEKDAFRGSLLGSIMIGDKVESIGQSAFSGCYRLKSITIPNSVTNIGKYAFSGCTGLQTLCLPVRFEDSTSSMAIPSGCSVVFYSLEPLSIIEDSLPSGVVGRIYSASLKTTNGANQVTWTATGLPAGLKMESYRFSGSISGRPTEKGIFPVVVSAVDGMGGTAEKSFELIIEAPALSITTASLPNGDTQEEYSTVLSATGGFGELIWSATGLPSGLSCSSSGTISGTPAQSGTFIVVATVTDSLGTSAVATFSLVIDEPSPPLAISTDATLPDGLVLQAYEVTLEATGGTEPYAWNVSEPSELPSGLSLSAAGVLSGTPTAAGSYSFCVFVSSADGQTASKTVSLDVTPAPLAIVTDATLPVALNEEWYWLPLEATGGEEPYVWEIVDEDDWPEWLSSDYINYWDDWGYGCPYLSGTPYEGNIGSHSFALRVTDAEGTSVEKTFTLEVIENPNHAPVIESWSPESTRFRLDPGATTNLSVVVTDPDGDELTYSWTIYDEYWNWLENGDSTSASYAFSRAVGEEGTIIVQVCVSDGSRAAYRSWTVVVAEKTPLAIVTDATLPVALTDASYWQPLEATGGEEPYAWEIADEDAWPGWLSSDYIDDWDDWGYDCPFLSGWPGEDDIGIHTFALRVTDAEGTSVEKTFTLEVIENPNHAPVIESRSPEAYSVAIREGTTALFSIEASDPDGDELEIAWTLSSRVDEEDYFSWIADLATNAQGQVAVSPSEGVYRVDARASDGSRDSYASWNVTVVSADAPMIDTDLPHAVEGVYYETLLAATGGTAPYTWSANCWAVELSEDGLLVFDTDGWDFEGDFTTSDFDVTVTDAAGRSTTQTLTLVIERNPNERPVIDSISPEGWEYDDEGITPIGAPIVFSVEAHDPEGEPLAFEWRLDEEVLGETGDTWSWTPGRADRGHHRLSVHCSDGERESWWSWWYFEVVSTNVLSASVELPIAVVGTPYSAAFAVSGGTEPYVWGGPEYAMTRETNSFAESGEPQDWAEDDESWSVSLPFSFPFFGQTYDEIWVSDNGTICLDGSFSKWEFDKGQFTSHALIAPLWADLDGEHQTIYVDSSVSGQVTIRWATLHWGASSGANVIAFAATLCADGSIRFVYDGPSCYGSVGVSAGDGARFMMPDELQDVSLGSGKDVVLRPATFAPGLELSSDGRVSGTPTAAGTYRIPVTVVDAEGASWSGETVLYVVEDGAPVTLTTPVPVPYAWLDGFALGDGSEAGYETAANAPAANGANDVWACYVAGLDPTNATSRFFAEIDATVDPPRVSWTPDLNEGGTKNERVYTVEGKTNLVDTSWGPTNEATRFFRVKVSMPE